VLFDPSGYECNNNEVQPTPRNRCPRTLSPCFFSWKLTLVGLSGDFKLHGSPLCIYRLTTNKESRRTGRPQTPKLSRLLAQKAMGHQPRPRRRLCVRFPIFRGKADQLTIGLKGCGESYPTTVPIVAAVQGPELVPFLGHTLCPVGCPPCLYFYIRSPPCVTEPRLVALVLRLNESVCFWAQATPDHLLVCFETWPACSVSLLRTVSTLGDEHVLPRDPCRSWTTALPSLHQGHALRTLALCAFSASCVCWFA